MNARLIAIVMAVVMAVVIIALAPGRAVLDIVLDVVLDLSIAPAQGAGSSASTTTDTVLTPEEKMRRRFPQPARVGDLIGLRVLDEGDSTIGFVRQVVRTPEGKIKLIVVHGGWFGWGTRLVAVPIEAVAILGRQIAALDMPPSEFASAPTWPGTGGQILPNDEIIRIALGRR